MRSRTIFLVCVVLAVGLADGASAARFSFKLDFGLEGQNVPEGFCEISGGDGSSPEPWIVYDVGGTGIDVNLTTTWPRDALGFRDNGFHPLFGDCIFVDNYPDQGVVVTLSGLEPGDYTFTGYHNNIWGDGGLNVGGVLDAYVDGVKVVSELPQTEIVTPDGDFNDVAFSNFVFTITEGQDSVEFEFLSVPVPNEPTYRHIVVNGLIIEGYEIMAASDPSPPDGAENVEPDVVLSWKPGDYAVSHDVYFGTDFYAVLNATTSSPEYKGSQDRDANSYDPTPGGELLDLGLTYYWRVDEVNDVDKWTGDVWSFTVKGPKAYNPCPADGIWSVAIDANLSWMAGAFATSHDVYFGTDPGALSLVSPGQVSTSYDPGPLETGQIYYWRIDEHGPLGDFPGDLWSFSTVGSIVLHYRFDETDGNTAADFSGHGLDGTVDEPYWDPDGQIGGCLGFDVNTVVSSPKILFSNIGRGITVALWLNGSESPRIDDDYFNYLFNAGYGGGGPFACALGARVPREWGEWDQGVDFVAGKGGQDHLSWCCDSEPEDWQGEWNHYAFVKDEIEQTMRIYHNGLPVAEKTGVNPDTLALFRNRGILIGRGWEHGFRDHFQGRLDDFRIYDYALSDLEIVRLLRGGDLGLAWGPRPRDGAVDVPQDMVLAWQPGDYAASHDVYFGTDWDDVNDANASSPEYKDRQDVADINYAPPGLFDLGTTYYWRIDEVNDANADSPWKGKVWSFTTIAYLVVDDMESYDLVVNRISDTWIDGWDNNTGSEISLGTADVGDPVHGGKQSMIYAYDNGDSGGWDLDYYSEVERTFDTPQDWISFNVKALTLYFYGDPHNDANATEQMYVGLEDSRGVSSYAEVKYGHYSDEDMNDIKVDDWQEWSIALSDFTGVNLEQVKKVYIGLGIRGNLNPSGTPGGMGTVYFDDIRLYVPRCLPWAPKHPADFNGDCIVDIDDLGIMADDWLEYDYTVAAQAPGPSVLQYNFDESYGGTADDSSGNNYDGKAKDINDLAVEAIWQTGGKSGGCIRFDKTKDYALEIPVAAFNSHINNQITVTVWVNWDDPDTMPAETNQLLSVHSGDNRVIGVETEWKAGRLRFWDISAGTTYTAREQDWSGGWNHYAFVKDVAGGYMRIYLNGKLVAENTSSAPMLFPANLARIGMATDSWHDDYTGLVDDFRIYSSALSQAEIAHVITGGPDLYIPIDTPVNLYDEEPANSRAVNFRDYAELINSWLEELLWPAE